MMRRTPRTEKFAAAIQAMGPLVVGPANPRDGWPGQLLIRTSSGPVNVALHVSSISSHARAPHERRFQNPGDTRPVSDFGGTALPVLLGTRDPETPNVFVAIDGHSRLGRRTRFSILFHKMILREAAANGWAMYESNTGEKIYAFVPALFPTFLEQIRAGEMLPLEQIREAAVASGIFDTPADPAATALAANRATKAVNILVRKAGTGRKIRAAYNNQCAMCGIGANLLAGAHIYPVEAPNSNDEVWNGLSLCHNHHGAFDLHLIWVDPLTKAIHLHPSLHNEALQNAAMRHFIDSTQPTLIMPAVEANRPRREMFEQRYAHYEGKYNWA